MEFFIKPLSSLYKYKLFNLLRYNILLHKIVVIVLFYIQNFVVMFSILISFVSLIKDHRQVFSFTLVSINLNSKLKLYTLKSSTTNFKYSQFGKKVEVKN